MKTDMSHLGKALRERGYRLTPQRMTILAALEASEGHISAEDIYAQVSPVHPYMHISTVYRTLKSLEEMGLVTRTDTGEGVAQYHWGERGHHHHLVCQECGITRDIEHPLFHHLEEAILQQYKFRASFDHLVIFGRCQNCGGRTSEGVAAS